MQDMHVICVLNYKSPIKSMGDMTSYFHGHKTIQETGHK